jgi:hypothetical protein
MWEQKREIVHCVEERIQGCRSNEGRVNQAKKYRRHAADCFAVAQHLNDPLLKEAMLGMARSWSTLADYAEQSSGVDFRDAAPTGADYPIQ